MGVQDGEISTLLLDTGFLVVENMTVVACVETYPTLNFQTLKDTSKIVIVTIVGYQESNVLVEEIHVDEK